MNKLKLIYKQILSAGFIVTLLAATPLTMVAQTNELHIYEIGKHITRPLGVSQTDWIKPMLNTQAANVSCLGYPSQGEETPPAGLDCKYFLDLYNVAYISTMPNKDCQYPTGAVTSLPADDLKCLPNAINTLINQYRDLGGAWLNAKRINSDFNKNHTYKAVLTYTGPKPMAEGSNLQINILRSSFPYCLPFYQCRNTVVPIGNYQDSDFTSPPSVIDNLIGVFPSTSTAQSAGSKGLDAKYTLQLQNSINPQSDSIGFFSSYSYGYSPSGGGTNTTGYESYYLSDRFEIMNANPGGSGSGSSGSGSGSGSSGSGSSSSGVCGNGSVEGTEECDVGALLNLNPDLGCTSTCEAINNLECAGGQTNFIAWKDDYDNLVNTYSSCLNLTTGAQIPAVCSNAGSNDIKKISSYRKYITAVNSSCTSSLSTGGYDKLTLGTQEIYIRCSSNTSISDPDRRLLSITNPKNYTPNLNTTCDTTPAPVELNPGMILDSTIKSCQLHCDDDNACAAVEEIITPAAGGTAGCKLYSTCSAPATTGGTSGTNLHIKQ